MYGNKRFLTLRMAATLAAAIMTGSAAYPADSASPVENPTFKQLDANRDAYVDRDEGKKLKGFDKAFREADENRDGKLDADEFVKAQSVYERMRVEQFIDDSIITARIKAALFKDPQVSALDVKVETHMGTVLLSGFVDDEKQARRAAEIATWTRGVTAVRNGLVVKNGPERRAGEAIRQ